MRTLPMLGFVLMLTGCGASLPVIQQTRPVLPPLPEVARQPSPPQECVPSCLERLSNDLQRLLNLRIDPEPPAKPAKPLMGA